jgi:fructose-1,6-bisphosphatase/inositol monophosphatase family enzyme
MVSLDPAKVGAIMAEVAAEVVMPRFRHLAEDEVRTKAGPRDFVTIADTEAEALLSRRLPDLLPGSLVVGEEAVAADKSRLGLLESAEPVWIVDPVDGTANFATGHAVFGMIVALVQGGRLLGGWIYDPVNGRTAWAMAGEGAWMGEKRLHVAACAPLSAMSGAFYSKSKLPQLSATVARRVCSGCAAHDYLKLIDGQLNFALFTRLMPWDHAAGVLIHAEAGGYSRLIDGGAYRPVPLEGTFILASDKASWEALRGLVG